VKFADRRLKSELAPEPDFERTSEPFPWDATLYFCLGIAVASAELVRMPLLPSCYACPLSDGAFRFRAIELQLKSRRRFQAIESRLLAGVREWPKACAPHLLR